MTIYKDHIADLKASGISRKQAAEAGWHSVKGPKLSARLGFNLPENVTCLVIPYDENGAFRAKLFPAQGDMRYCQPRGSGVNLYVPPGVDGHLDDCAIPLYISEGEKKALAGTVRGVLTLGIGGIWSWRQKDENGISLPIKELGRIAWADRECYLVPDSDIWSREDLRRPIYALGRELEDLGANVSVIQLPKIEGLSKTGLDDYLVRYSTDKLQGLKRFRLGDRAFTKAKRWYGKWLQKIPRPSAGAAKLPTLDADDENLARLGGETWEVLVARNSPPWIFLFGDRKVCVMEEPILQTQPVGVDRLRHELVKISHWVRHKKGVGVIETYPPTVLLKDMLVRSDAPLPGLTALVGFPFYTRSGHLRYQNGYCPESGYYCRLALGLKVPRVDERPSVKLLSKALGLLDEMLGDFPFVSPAERAHALSFMITPFVRDLIAGPTPLHLFEGPTPGTGKSLLACALGIASLGRAMGCSAEAGSVEEWRKQITSVLLGSPTYFLIDNVNAPLRSGHLSGAIASDFWSDRILGKNEKPTLPVRCVWGATANNPSLSTEIARRSVRIRLDARMDRPWERPPSVFKHPALLSWAVEQRPNLLAAIIVLVNRWLAAGRPGPADGASLGGFESWASVVGGILSHAGVEGFLGNLQEFYEETDQESQEIRVFVGLWWDAHKTNPVGVNLLFELVQQHNLSLPLGLARTDHGLQINFGRFLKSLKGRVFDDKRVAQAGTYNRAIQWRLEVVKTEPEKKESQSDTKTSNFNNFMSLMSLQKKTHTEKNEENRGLNESNEYYESPLTFACARNTCVPARVCINKKDRQKDSLDSLDSLTTRYPSTFFYEYSYESTLDSYDIFVDIETTGLDPKRDKLSLIQILKGDTIHLVRPGDDPKSLKNWFKKSVKNTLIFHNLAFDFAFLRPFFGKNRPKNVFCTLIFEALLSSGREFDLKSGLGAQKPFSLSSLVHDYVGVEMDKDPGVRLSFVPGADLTPKQIEYAADDVRYLPEILALQKRRAEELGLMPVVQLESRFAIVLGEIVETGVRVADLDSIEAFRSQVVDDLAKLQERINREAGRVVKPGSPRDVHSLLVERGTYRNTYNPRKPTSTEKAVLEQIDDSLASMIIEYRGLSQFRNGFLNDLRVNTEVVLNTAGKPKTRIDKGTGEKEVVQGAIDPDTWRVYPKYTQFVDTGRATSRAPHVQGIPRKYRGIVVAAPGCKLVSGDWSQIELRILAAMSEDEYLLRMFQDQKDLHLAMASKVFGISYEDVTPAQRQIGKVLNFSLLYGRGPRTLAAELGVSETEATGFIDSYFAAMPRARDLLVEFSRQAFVELCVTSMYGRKRFFSPWYRKRASGRFEDDSYRANQAKNAPIQMTGADILKLAAVEIAEALNPYAAHPVLLNHDEILIETKEFESQAVADILKREMERAGNEVLKVVPVVVEPKISDKWEK